MLLSCAQEGCTRLLRLSDSSSGITTRALATTRFNLLFSHHRARLAISRMLRDSSTAFAADLISLFAIYRSQLLTLGVAICVGLLANVGRKSARERAVAFAWKRPAEADPAWTGAVLDNPTIHADGSGTITAYDPSTGFKIGTFPSPTPQDMYDLVTRAERASHTWKKTTFAQRRRVLRSLLDWIIRDKRAIAEICCRDTGKTMLDGALGEILVTLEKIRWMLVYAEDYLKPEQRPTSWVLAHKVSKVHYEPFGIVGAIVSWNYRQCARLFCAAQIADTDRPLLQSISQPPLTSTGSVDVG